ncbi:hypothetical protein JCM9279_002028 [Rhodotorula babjevae]
MQGTARQPSQARPRPSTASTLRSSSASRFTAAPTMAAVLVLGIVASILQLPTPAHAYIPAVPVNDTSSLDSSSDLLHLAFQNGVYNTPISRQLWAEGFDDSGNYTNISTIVPWTKFSKGVLLHFDETLRNQPPTSVPWIAMISCDTNGTNPSDEDDIFTITRDLGAQAALLYSLTSEGCQITEEYLTTFEKVLDVYATTTLQGSRIIEQQFVNVNAAAAEYDSLTLNNSASIAQALLDSNALSVIGNVPINASSTSTDDDSGETAMSTVDPTAIAAATSPSVFDPDNDGSSSSDVSATDAPATSSATAPSLFSGTSAAAGRLVRRQAAPTVPTGSPPTRTSSSASATSTAFGVSQNYLGAVMAAANVTVGGLNPPSASASASSGGGGGGATSTSLAMVILYAITGVVTALFLVVIMSGAIRAARHPERYGPRPGGAGGPGGAGTGEGQTRASGLTRAILDTFPVVKFGNGGGAQSEERRDEEAGPLGGDDDDERKKAGAAAGHGEQIELAVLPSMAPAIPMARSGSVDGPAPRGVPPTAAPLAAAAEARPRAASRASTSAESFHSAASTPAAEGHSTSTLEPLPAAAASATASSSSAAALDPAAAATASTVSPSQAAVDATLADAADAAEADLCPICFCDFEDGDELRVLPCDNRHRFHSACIDPFLLNVSRLCPLCRLDLATVGAPHAGTDEASQQQQQAGDDGAPRTSEGDGSAEGERHEEERVIRHLRALLHRGSHSSPAGSARPLVPHSSPAGSARPLVPGASSSGAAGVGAGPEGADGVDGLDGGAAGFRNRFASYVTARRGRTRRGSSFSGPSRLGSSFSAWAAGPSGDGRIGAPV